MDEEQMRAVAAELRGELPRLIQDDREQTETDAALARVLAAPMGTARPVLFATLDALAAHPEVGSWLRKRFEDTERAIDVAGDPTVQLGVLFVCPHGDEDFVRETVGQFVPPCSIHHVPLVRAED
jgi:hypothetical protein